MSPRDEVKALRDEVAELRKQMLAMAVAMAELAANTPPQWVPYVVQPQPCPQPQPWPWWQPVITYSSGRGVAELGELGGMS